MKPGLRLQILLLLGGLMLLAFVPLFFAVATYASYTLQQVRDASARALGRAVAGHVAEARARRSPDQLLSLLEAEIGTEGVEAIGIYDPSGAVLARAGEPAAVSALPTQVDPVTESVSEVQADHGRALAIRVPDELGAVVAVLRADDQAARTTPLVRLVGLYSGLFAFVLLVLAYFALTRLIVRPLDRLSSAAERVASGARHLEVPAAGARELVELGASLKVMTDRLLREEEALRRKVTEVEEATSHLREAQSSLVRSERLASVGRLAAGLAHEIGNPISALIGMQDLLLDGELAPEEQRDFMVRMRKETERIHTILRDLLQFARPGANAARGAPPEPGDVATAARDTAALVAPQRTMQGVELVLEIAPVMPAVRLSHEQLMQVVLNLVMNAADACGEGHTIVIRAAPHASGVRLEVEDDGPGIPAELREQIFEPFVTTKEVGKGTGLGLAVCRGLIESAGGTISLDASRPTGARFVLELPAADRAAAQ
ncbi:MAG: HAMP domain-containing sensor histidine kinase [Polyangiaceae bacterium]|nr:HAMP domain-containing sensor histidine kinase [Polyangiaceae bacterium]